jgi:Skp family chaperone for outer membrane proteins
MVVSSRGILAIGLGLTGLAFLVGPSLGQGPAQDSTIRKTANPEAKTNPPAPVAPFIGTIDLELVFKNYEKVKVSQKEFNAALTARKNELMQIMSQAQEEAQIMAKLTNGTEDYRKRENKVTELKARHEAMREQAQREFDLRTAESMATFYKEIQAMVTRVAHWRKLTYIFKVSSQQPVGTDPNSVMAAVSNTVMYFDKRNDITADVIHNLNLFYGAATGTTTSSTKPPARAIGGPAGTQPTGAMPQPDNGN